MRLPVEYKTAEDALSVVQSGNRVFVHGSAQTPLYLLRELGKMSPVLRDVELTFITVQGDIELDKLKYANSFHINCMFVSGSVRKAVNEGRADFIPVFLSDIPDLFRTEMHIDVALVQVSPPDKHGYCSLGVSVDIARSAVNTATHIVAQVNPRVPRTHGDSLVHTTRFTSIVYHEEELPEVDYGAKVGPQELKIGKLIAGMIENGSTLQLVCIPKCAAIASLICSTRILSIIRKKEFTRIKQ
jgi:acyl-CoA hydrolase